MGSYFPTAWANGPSLSPLRPFATTSGSSGSGSADTAKSDAPRRLPPLPLFAQADPAPSRPDPTGATGAPAGTGSSDAAPSSGLKKPAEKEDTQPVPFATPAPGSVIDDDDDDGSGDKKEQKKEKRIECNTDAQCPAQTVCARHVCKSVKPMTSAIFYFHRPGPIGFRMVLPFYFHFWHPEHKTRALLPLFVDKRDNHEGTRDIWAFPTYQYHREPGERTHRIWPLFFYSNYGKEGRTVGLLPFFWSKQRNGVSTTVIPPLLFYERRDENTRERDTVFLPLLMYLRQRQDDALGLFLGLGYYRKLGDKVNGGFFPLVSYSSSPAEHRTMVLPLFFEGGNHETGSRYATLVPLFLYLKGADKSQLLLTPLGGWYRDEQSKEETMALLTPPLIHRDTPSYRFSLLFPIGAYWQNKQTGHRFGFAGPFFYSRDDEGGSDGMVPLFLRFQSYARRSSTSIIPPLLAVFHKSPQLKLGVLGPIYGWSRTRDGAFGGGLLPLLSFQKGPHSHVALLPPLLIYTADREAGRYHFSLGPFFYRYATRGAEAGYDAGIFPLLFLSRHGARSTQALLPLFYHHREPGKERLQLGLFYWDRTCPQFFGDKRAAVHTGLAPLLFIKRSPDHGYTVLFPLFFETHTRTASTLMAGPFFYHKQKLPGDEGERTTFGLLPLFYARRSPAESLIVAPLFGYRRTAERRTLLIGPYVETVASPGKPDQAITRMFFPLFFFHCSPERRATVLFPLFMQVREEHTTFRSLALLYYGVNVDRGEGKSLRAHAFLPLLFLSVREPGRSTTVLGPFFHHRNEKTGGMAVGILPLFAYGHTPEKTAFMTPLGFYQKNHVTEHTRTAFLTFYGDFQRNRDDFGLFPLFFAARRNTARSVFVVPFFFHSHDSAEDRTFTTLGPLFFGRSKKVTYGGLLPLVYGRNDGDGGFRMMVFPLMFVSHRPNGNNWLITPLFGFENGPAGYRFYLGPLYVRRDLEQKSTALFPIFYDGENQKTRSRLSFLLPIFFRSSTPDKSLTMVTPLFWHQRTLTSRVTFLFPLFLDVHSVFRERTTAVGPVVPLFVRMRDETTDSTSWIFPPILTYVKRTPTSTTAITFPLVWHWKSADRQTTVLFPLVFYAQRPATKTVVVLPLFGYRRDEHDNRSTMILPLLTWWRNGGDGSRERVVFPFVWHFKNAERQTTVVFPLVWHAKRPNYTVTVFLPFGAHWKTEKGHYTLVLNTYVYKGDGDYKGAWGFHFWPVFSVGRPRPQDLEWTILSGFIGYSREGVNRTLQLLWGIKVALEPVGAQTAWFGATWRMASEN